MYILFKLRFKSFFYELTGPTWQTNSHIRHPCLLATTLWSYFIDIVMDALGVLSMTVRSDIVDIF